PQGDRPQGDRGPRRDDRGPQGGPPRDDRGPPRRDDRPQEPQGNWGVSGFTNSPFAKLQPKGNNKGRS
ncbi:MAG: hypothetical protein ABIY55_12490, partial [Kofleriaceae bacterium]